MILGYGKCLGILISHLQWPPTRVRVFAMRHARFSRFLLVGASEIMRIGISQALYDIFYYGNLLAILLRCRRVDSSVCQLRNIFIFKQRI